MCIYVCVYTCSREACDASLARLPADSPVLGQHLFTRCDCRTRAVISAQLVALLTLWHELRRSAAYQLTLNFFRCHIFGCRKRKKKKGRSKRFISSSMFCNICNIKFSSLSHSCQWNAPEVLDSDFVFNNCFPHWITLNNTRHAYAGCIENRWHKCKNLREGTYSYPESGCLRCAVRIRHTSKVGKYFLSKKTFHFFSRV